MPTLVLTNFNIVVSVLGGWVSLFGLVSYLCKENFYLSEALISLLAGVAFSPSAANFVRPLQYAGSQANLDAVTLHFSRLVLGVQLVLAGVQLPSRYLKKQWRPLLLLLGPVMTGMWLVAGLLVWALVTPRMPFLHALAIGACVAPTDPVLSNVVVKGRFADQNVPVELQRIIIAESGANDGLGYPFLFLALYLIQYTGASGESGGAARTMGLWFGETWGYTILLSVAYGSLVGYVAKELLHWAEERHYCDRESFLVFAISLALFTTGTCGLLGSDDVLACFVAGNVFTWDDWFRLETQDDTLQPTIDMLLNVAIFMWLGAVCPWSLFAHGPVPLYRLVLLGILVLLLRRLPWVLALHRYVPQIEHLRHAVFVGFFGPVGVSAIFYLYVTLEFVDGLSSTDRPRPDVARLGDTATVVVWFLSICSIVVHGLSIPVGKLGLYLPRTLSRSLPSSTSAGRTTGLSSGTDNGLPPFHIGSRVSTLVLRRSHNARRNQDQPSAPTQPATAADRTDVQIVLSDPDGEHNTTNININTAARPVYRIGGSIIPSRVATDGGEAAIAFTPSGPSTLFNRTIRFPDEPLSS
ncbi:cation/H+ exchanger [Grosmannia clavigera kw1407]|uniref:Cation/H+ exchanger n=1 Tax=Grosmannia clavigera (strain kw1407 / UAMH 11150) TaxID=655863 RepID=F0XTP0_GROCL|nr:cation/H+ exchanger [Grosmannia clavigera kw1407]EFW98596.1 cation/H+ exchanger [Grosmannia clavigera kw1407]